MVSPEWLWGVPVKLGKEDIKQIIELKLTDEEEAKLKRSADAAREPVQVMGI